MLNSLYCRLTDAVFLRAYHKHKKVMNPPFNPLTFLFKFKCLCDSTNTVFLENYILNKIFMCFITTEEAGAF